MSVKTKVITVTPKDAASYISGMVNNRPPAEKHISFLASAMKKGEWDITGQPVIFSKTGRLLDGQHRMRAVMSSGVTVQMLAVYGIEDELYLKMDQGRIRSAADCMVGVPNALQVAASVKLIFAEMRSAKGSQIHVGNHKPSNKDVHDTLAMHRGLIEVASDTRKFSRALRMCTPSALTYCLYRMRADNAMLANQFVRQLNDGEGLSRRSPVLSIRNQLIDGKRVDGVLSRFSQTEIICCIAVGWYNVLDGKHVAVKIPSAPALWRGWRTAL